MNTFQISVSICLIFKGNIDSEYYFYSIEVKKSLFWGFLLVPMDRSFYPLSPSSVQRSSLSNTLIYTRV